MHKVWLAILLLGNVLLSCQCNDKVVEREETSSEVRKESLIEENQRWARQESRDIDNFVQRKGLQMETSGTGLRYAIEALGEGAKAQPGQVAVIDYRVSLLDGTLCYSTDSLGAEEFLVEMDDVESGLHEGIQLLRVGDKAKFIIPSHLAHGLAGDRQKIPMRSPIIYELELMALK